MLCRKFQEQPHVELTLALKSYNGIHEAVQRNNGREYSVQWEESLLPTGRFHPESWTWVNVGNYYNLRKSARRINEN